MRARRRRSRGGGGARGGSGCGTSGCGTSGGTSSAVHAGGNDSALAGADRRPAARARTAPSHRPPLPAAGPPRAAARPRSQTASTPALVRRRRRAAAREWRRVALCRMVGLQTQDSDVLSRKSPSGYPLRMAGRPPSPRRAARRAASVSSASLWWLLRIRAVFAEAILDAGRVVGTSEHSAHRFNGSVPVSCWTRPTTFRRAMKHRAPQLPAQAAAARSFADGKPVDCMQLTFDLCVPRQRLLLCAC